jgi:hypothetical protein
VQKPASRPRKTAPVDARISVDEAFQRLQRQEESAAARERLNAAIRAGKVRLWANDNVVGPSFFEGHVYVAAEVAPDGRWTAEMTMIRGVEGWKDIEWTVAGADVDGLLAQEAELKRRSGGAKRIYDREQILIEGAAVIFRQAKNGLPPSYSCNDLCGDVREFLGDKNPEDTLLKEILGPLHKRLKTGI